jgi:hypothetical protein
VAGEVDMSGTEFEPFFMAGAVEAVRPREYPNVSFVTIVNVDVATAEFTETPMSLLIVVFPGLEIEMPVSTFRVTTTLELALWMRLG